MPTALGAPASVAVIASTERALGFPLRPFHARVLREVGNGGFGPGFGLIGLPGGTPDADGRDLVQLRDALVLPEPVVPLCDWGCGMWSCVDSETGDVLVTTEDGLNALGIRLSKWLAAWSRGKSLWDAMVIVQEREGVNPFTKQRMMFKGVAGVRGVPYVVRARRTEGG